MRLEDFCSFFTDFDICCLCPSCLDGEEPCRWRTTMFEGRWVSEVTAGGCMNYKGIATMYRPHIISMNNCRMTRDGVLQSVNELLQLLRML